MCEHKTFQNLSQVVESFVAGDPCPFQGVFLENFVETRPVDVLHYQESLARLFKDVVHLHNILVALQTRRVPALLKNCLYLVR